MENIILSNRYRLLEKISEGGMSSIYRAYCNVLNRVVAVKILKQEFSNDEEFLKKFNNEAKSAASLNHPNIIGVYDVGTDGDVSYIVMEYVDGKNLKELIKENGSFSEKEALDITKQICLALKEAHNNGIVHRDIKPHNIMINKLGIVKVGDFGIAKAVTSSTITVSDNIMGSVHYISPEQAKGIHVDSRSDIYSLGVLLYELLIGKVPYNSDKAIDIALRHINEDIQIPMEYKTKLSESAQNIILKMTQKNKNQRYFSADQIISDIEKVQNNNETIRYFSQEEDYATKVIKIPKDKIEETQDKKRKRKKKSPLLKLSLLLLGLLFLAMIVFNTDVFNSITGAKNVVIPNIVGKSQSQGEEELEKIGLQLKIMSQREDDTKEEGIILDQNPSADLKIRKGEEISVIVSKKPEKNISVPSIVGLNEKDAKTMLENANLQITSEYKYSDTVEKDKIISQNPKADEKVKKNEIIRIEISKGKDIKQEKVPSFIGKTLQDAEKNKGNFVIGNISYKEDKTKKDGVILYQNPKEASMQNINSSIDLVVNKISEVVGGDNTTDNPQDTANRQSVSKTITLGLPQKDSMLLSIINKSDESTAYSETISTKENTNVNVTVKGYSGETRQYDIFIDGQYYATTGNIRF